MLEWYTCHRCLRTNAFNWYSSHTSSNPDPGLVGSDQRQCMANDMHTCLSTAVCYNRPATHIMVCPAAIFEISPSKTQSRNCCGSSQSIINQPIISTATAHEERKLLGNISATACKQLQHSCNGTATKRPWLAKTNRAHEQAYDQKAFADGC